MIGAPGPPRKAAQWWSRLGTKAPVDVSEADREEFTQWLRESQLHVAELLHVAHVHDVLEQFKLWDEIPLETQAESTNISTLPVNEGANSANTSVRKRSWRVGLLVAASVSLVAVAAGWWVLFSGVTTLETDRAERREVVLNDGSVLNLDPETQVRIDLGRHQRFVALTRGRALFQVAKDPSRPFIVRAGDTQVRVIGTTFGVEEEDQSTIVTVSEGKVAVAPTSQLEIAPERAGSGEHEPLAQRIGQAGRGDASSMGDASSIGSANPIGDTGSPEPAHARNVFLTANQQITVRKSGGATPVREVDSSRALAWSQGRLIFDSTPLSEVAAEFNRYNRMQLQINSPELAQRTVSGVFRASDPQTLIDFISAGAHVIVTRTDDTEIVISPAP